jgi:hypothetical protein
MKDWNRAGSGTFAGFVLVALMCAATPRPSQAQNSFIGPLNTVQVVASTVPQNGDINPYGVFRVPVSTGMLIAGDILVSNFNNTNNLQGTGTTIVEISPAGAVLPFAKIDASNLPGSCPGGVGLTTALVVLRTGWVIVGSLPTTDGTAATAGAGCLLVLNNQGQVVETFSGAPINGPWDATIFDGSNQASLFFTNVLNGTVAGGGHVVNQATVVRFLLSVSTTTPPVVMQKTVIASGLPARTDPAALVIGPTGLALSGDNSQLFVNDSLLSRIAAIANPLSRSTTAGKGVTLTQYGALNDPLGLTRAPNGDIIAADGSDGNLVEVTPSGVQVAKKLVQPSGAGDLFGLVATSNRVYFVNDGTNTLNVLQ